MKNAEDRQRPRLLLVAAAAVVVQAGLLETARALEPESREVQAAVAKAVQFLESEEGRDDRVGAKALVGLALLKSGKSPQHPQVVEAATEIRAVFSQSTPNFSEMYTPGLALIFLVEMNSPSYAPEIEQLLKYSRSTQKSNGGWGYPEKRTGDTSMTQYMVLGLWEAKRSGYHVDSDMIERVLLWLLKTRDPSGGFGYQGNVAEDFVPVAQERVRHGLTAAGAASTYACADLLEIFNRREKREDLPPALREVPEGQGARAGSRIDRGLVKTTLAGAAAWLQRSFTVAPVDWPYYYLYTLERYCSFREAAEGEAGLASWYDTGARHLLKTQAEDGSWHDPQKALGSPACNTAWGVLFLVRSMKKSIQRAQNYGDGLMVGGRGLPASAVGLAVVGGNVVAKPDLDTLNKMLASLEDADSPESGDALSVLADLPAGVAQPWVEKHARRLQDLAGDASPEARLAAVRSLAKARDLDHVPTLIYALTDPEPAIVREARDGLRRISRKFGGFGLPDEPTELELAAAIKQWKAWYQTIRPDAEFRE